MIIATVTGEMAALGPLIEFGADVEAKENVREAYRS